MRRRDYIYAYNFKQSLFFIESGLIPVEIGRGGEGDTYHKFKRNDELEMVFTEWIERVDRTER